MTHPHTPSDSDALQHSATAEAGKTFMFQFYRDTSIRTRMVTMSGTECVENTGLITLKEAEKLWEQHYDTLVKDIEYGQYSQMCIWKDCDSPTDYNSVLKEIDGRDDLEVINGRIFLIERTPL